MTVSVRLVLSIAAVLSMVVTVTFSPQLTTEITLSKVQSILRPVASWLRPPYLYLVINCIIITIFASSKLHEHHHDYSEPIKLFLTENHYDGEDQRKLVDIPQSSTEIVEFSDKVYGNENYSVPTEIVEVYENENYGVPPEIVELSDKVYGNENYSVPTTKPMTRVNDVQPVESNNDNARCSDDGTTKGANVDTCKLPGSDSFTHPKIVQPDTEGRKKLGVPKPERELETLESTWKAITDGRNNMMIKSETFNQKLSIKRNNISTDDGTTKGANVETWKLPGSDSFIHPKVVQPDTEERKKLEVPKPERDSVNLESTWKAITDGRNNMMIKSETFNQKLSSKRNNISRTLAGSSCSGKLKRDPSLGQDELNKRAEAFISRFKEDMRLQRKESLRQYVEMINSGAY